MSDFATAMQFVFTLVGELIIGLCVLTYAMHCLIVVTRDTAAGNDEVTWPAEPFQDWAGGALHLVLVVVLCLAPAGLLARGLRKEWLPDEDALRFLLLAIPALWLFFPVALFSSLSGSSQWFVFRPVVVWNMLRVAPSALAVYAISALLAAGVGALGYASITGGRFILLPVAAVGAAAAFLIYARLLGRLAWKMGRVPSGKREPAKKARPDAAPAQVDDPWAAPDKSEEPEPPLPAEEKTAYGRTRPRTAGYGLAAEEAAKPPEEIVPEKPAARTVRNAERPRPKRLAPPRRSLLGGVFTFPWYERCRKAWLLLSLGFLAVGAGAGFLLSLFLKLSQSS